MTGQKLPTKVAILAFVVSENLWNYEF